MKTMYRHYLVLPIAAKAALWFTFGNFILKGIGLFSVPLFTRLLPTDEYGYLMVMLTSQQIILILATWEMPIGAYMRGLFKFKDSIREYTTATLALIQILTTICFLFLWLLEDMVSSKLGLGGASLKSLFVYLLFYPAYQCWMVRQRVNDCYKYVVAMSIIWGVASVVIPLGAISWIGCTAEVKYVSTLLAGTGIAVFFYGPYFRPAFFRAKWEQVLQYWGFSFRFQGPAVLHSLSYLILSQADRIMIGGMIGATEAAYYCVAYTLSQAFSLFQASILQALLPWQYKQLEEKCYEKIKAVNNNLQYFIIGGILLFELSVPDVLYVLFPHDYYEAVWCIPPISASLYFLFLYSLFVNVEEYFEKTHYVMYISLFCSAFNIAANYLLMPWLGYLVCAYTTLISYVMFAVGHFFFTRRVVEQYIGAPMEILFNGRALFLQSATAVILSFLILWLYSFPLFRYSIIVMTIVGGYLYRNKVKSLWKKYIRERGRI